ncbi:MAG: GHKL domain-containing protein [Clostridiaceae bacterium]|nr:GHKL domain-containing protein [Clostridiaceae bacterium]
MKKRIYLNMALLTSIAILLISIILCLVFYHQFSKQIKKGLREQAQVFLNDNTESALSELQFIEERYLRATLILNNGDVLFDNTSEAQSLENHLERTEVFEAIKYGDGESSRYSQTLGLRTYYYAIRLTDGSVLRLAKTNQSILGLFTTVLPIVVAVIFLVIAISYIVAARLTTHIVAPINKINLDGELSSPYDELAPLIRTISGQRKKIAEDFAAMQKVQDTIHAITENMNEGMLMVGAGGIILSINRSATKIFDTDSSFEGHNIRELSRDLSFINAIQKALSGDGGNMIFTKNSKIYNVLISPVFETGAILFLLDITEKARADERRREFSANVSHELKTPLTSIYGNAEMLYEGMVKEKDKQSFYEKIKKEASQLMILIEDIIKISELDEKNDVSQLETLELASLTAECKESLAQKAAEYSIKINIKGKGYINGNRTMIREMIYNLLDNAIKYNKQNGSVYVEVSEEHGKTKIALTDTGIGIPQNEQERIFERFYRTDRSRSKKTGGTGLGLAIVKHIVMAHSGSIKMTSKPEKGTKIIIYFPNVKELN